MPEIHVASEQVITAPPDQVYTYLADYLHHHPNFLPPAFSQYRVEEGGTGAGTVVSYRLKAGGRERAYRARVAEPEPGRVLTETYEDGTVTAFTVSPSAEGTLVHIETRYRVRGAVRAWIEQRLAPRALLPIFKDELERLDAYARAPVSAESGTG